MVLERWKNVTTFLSKMAADQFAEYCAEVRGHRQITAFVQLLDLKPGPLTMDATASNRTAKDHHDVSMAMIGSRVSIFLRSTTEFGHGDENDVFHPVAHVTRKCGE